MRRSEYFYDRKSILDTKKLPSTKNKDNSNSLITEKARLTSMKIKDENHLFKEPNSNTLLNRKGNLRPTISEKSRLPGRLKNDSKSIQQPKMSFRPCASFINPSRKSLHSSTLRNNQSRKDLIKKMVYLAECALKENKEIKQSTPVKLLPVGTPTTKKTPRSRGYLVLPEFIKKVPNINEMRSPLKDLVKREFVNCTSVKQTPSSVKKKVIVPIEENGIILNCNNKFAASENDISLNLTANKANVQQILEYLQTYNVKMTEVYEKLQIVDKQFEASVKELCDSAIYEEFCLYQAKKQDLNDQIKIIEDELSLAMRDVTHFGDNLKLYIKKNQQIFDEQVKLNKNFKSTVEKIYEKFNYDEKTNMSKEFEESKISSEEKKPKLRRSLRLSKLPKKISVQETTPMKKKLSKLNSKSKGIHKARKSPCKKSQF